MAYEFDESRDFPERWTRWARQEAETDERQLREDEWLAYCRGEA